MAAVKLFDSVVAGETLERTIAVYDVGGGAKDLTGWTVVGSFSTGAGDLTPMGLFTTSIDDPPSAGVVRYKLRAIDSVKFLGDYSSQVFVKSGEFVHVVGRGTLFVQKGVPSE